MFSFRNSADSKDVVEKQTLYQIGLCLDYVYIYIYNNCASPVYGQVYADYTSKAGQCNPIVETQDITCARYEFATCGNKNAKICDNSCYWVNCSIINENSKNETVFGQCLPITKIQ